VTSIACTTDIGNMDLAPYLSDVCHDFAELAPHCEINYLPDGSMSIATDRAVHDVNLVISSLNPCVRDPSLLTSPNIGEALSQTAWTEHPNDEHEEHCPHN